MSDEMKYLDESGLRTLWNLIKKFFQPREEGKGLSSNDFTNEDKTAIESIGDLNILKTENKEDLVKAINELKQKIDDIYEIIQWHPGPDDPEPEEDPTVLKELVILDNDTLDNIITEAGNYNLSVALTPNTAEVDLEWIITKIE